MWPSSPEGRPDLQRHRVIFKCDDQTESKRVDRANAGDGLSDYAASLRASPSVRLATVGIVSTRPSSSLGALRSSLRRKAATTR
jgi:hypothetical protein